MTGNRPYRPALTDTDAISELQRCAGTQFDPAIVAALVELLATRATATLAHRC
jgi:HD-GYP domain-containing protein (c-di-GMP phosphodiesterase class II)